MHGESHVSLSSGFDHTCPECIFVMPASVVLLFCMSPALSLLTVTKRQSREAVVKASVNNVIEVYNDRGPCSVTQGFFLFDRHI